jgi:hypothetical protein
MGTSFLKIEKEDRLRCKQIVFPAGFYLSESNKVYTPEISPLYRLATNKKDAEASDLARLVQQVGKSLHQIRDEIARWRVILDVPYQDYLLSK